MAVDTCLICLTGKQIITKSAKWWHSQYYLFACRMPEGSASILNDLGSGTKPSGVQRVPEAHGGYSQQTTITRLNKATGDERPSHRIEISDVAYLPSRGRLCSWYRSAADELVVVFISTGPHPCNMQHDKETDIIFIIKWSLLLNLSMVIDFLFTIQHTDAPAAALSFLSVNGSEYYTSVTEVDTWCRGFQLHFLVMSLVVSSRWAQFEMSNAGQLLLDLTYLLYTYGTPTLHATRLMCLLVDLHVIKSGKLGTHIWPSHNVRTSRSATCRTHECGRQVQLS